MIYNIMGRYKLLRPILRCLSAEPGVLNNKFITCTILLTRETERAFLLKSIKIQTLVMRKPAKLKLIACTFSIPGIPTIPGASRCSICHCFCFLVGGSIPFVIIFVYFFCSRRHSFAVGFAFK